MSVAWTSCYGGFWWIGSPRLLLVDKLRTDFLKVFTKQSKSNECDLVRRGLLITDALNSTSHDNWLGPIWWPGDCCFRYLAGTIIIGGAARSSYSSDTRWKKKKKNEKNGLPSSCPFNNSNRALLREVLGFRGWKLSSVARSGTSISN